MYRSGPGAREVFEVERFEPMTVLDLLLSIQRNHDPSFGFRYSCRVGMCNVCGVKLDGEPVLACRVPLDKDVDGVRIEPMPDAPVVRDLVTSLDQFHDAWVNGADGVSQ